MVQDFVHPQYIGGWEGLDRVPAFQPIFGWMLGFNWVVEAKQVESDIPGYVEPQGAR